MSVSRHKKIEILFKYQTVWDYCTMAVKHFFQICNKNMFGIFECVFKFYLYVA